jgi:hypothetical protein
VTKERRIEKPRKFPCLYCGVQGNHFPAGVFLPEQRPRLLLEGLNRAQNLAFASEKPTLSFEKQNLEGALPPQTPPAGE